MSEQGMSERGHKLIEEYYLASWAIATAKRDADIYAAQDRLRKAFNALEEYVVYLESGGA